MKIADLKKLGFIKLNGFYELDLKHGFVLIEGDKNGYLDVFEINHETLRFSKIQDLIDFITLINTSK